MRRAILVAGTAAALAGGSSLAALAAADDSLDMASRPGVFMPPPAGDPHFRGPVASVAALPACTRDGDFRIALDTTPPQAYVCKAGTWYTGGTGAAGSKIYNGSGVPDAGLGVAGDYYIRTDTYDLYARGASAWSVLVNLRGTPGTPGTNGTNGTNGTDGAPGAAATISTGSVSTGAAGSSASVTNSGSASAAVFDFTIPRGDKGDKGDKGDSGSTATTPTDLSGLVVWLKADSLALTDGASVASWADSSGTGHTFTEATSGLQPVYHTGRINGLPALTFSGGQCLTNSSVALSTFSIFVVFRSTSGSGSGAVYEHSPNTNSNDGSYLNSGNNNAASVKRGGVGSSREFGCPACGANSTAIRFDWGNDDMWHTVLHAFGGTHQTHKVVPDGAFFSQQVANSSSLSSTATATTEMNLGCRDESGFWFTGDIAEFIVFSPRLSSAQERSVFAYLWAKYSL